MGQGKSNAARVTMLGAALDPLAILWVFVFANNGDFDAYQPRLARYHRGVDDHIAQAALDGLRELYSMVSDREGRLADLGAKKVTRTLAQRHVQLRPVVALFSECHELFGHPGYGQEAADLAAQVLRRGRKAAVTLAFDTQSSGGRDPAPHRGAGENQRVLRGQGVALQRRLPRRRLLPGWDPRHRATTRQGRGHGDRHRRYPGAVRDRQMVLHPGR